MPSSARLREICHAGIESVRENHIFILRCERKALMRVYMKIGVGDQGSVFGDGCFSQHVRRDGGFLSLSFHRDLLIHP